MSKARAIKGAHAPMTIAHKNGEAHVHLASPIDNLADAPPELRTAFLAEFAATVQRYGFDPATRSQTAAHEAAHVVVAHAVGYTITGARLEQRAAAGRTFWSGATWRTFPGEHKRTAVRVHDEPAFAFRSAVNDLAGFTGEAVARLAHPSSSLDERFRAAAICNALDSIWRMPARGSLALATAVCVRILRDNRPQFDAIRAHFQRNRWLSAVEAQRMLSRVGRFDLADLLVGDAQ